MAESRSAKRARYVAGAFARFGADQGFKGAGAGPELIEAFVKEGLAARAASTKGTYRSVLRRLCAHEAPRAASAFSASPAQRPYSQAERVELIAIASAQQRPWKRHSALAIIALGIGAGLRAREITQVLAADVVEGKGGLLVHMGAKAGREVEVRLPFGRILRQLRDALSPSSFLFHPEEADRHYANFVNVMASSLVSDERAPRLSSLRCRSTFICDHLEAGTKLSVILEQAGICEVESLLRYARHVQGAPGSKAELRKKLTQER
jgi:integrase